MILEDLRSARLKHRRGRRKEQADILATLIGDITKSCGNKKEVTDEICVQFLKKFISNAKENIEALESRSESSGNNCGDAIVAYIAEVELLSAHLPPQLSTQELSAIITSFLAGLPPAQHKIGVVMGHLAKNYKGTYDGRTAKEIIVNSI